MSGSDLLLILIIAALAICGRGGASRGGYHINPVLWRKVLDDRPAIPLQNYHIERRSVR